MIMATMATVTASQNCVSLNSTLLHIKSLSPETRKTQRQTVANPKLDALYDFLLKINAPDVVDWFNYRTVMRFSLNAL